jgi:hypothetical protein
MTAQRLRPVHEPVAMAAIYPVPHDSSRWRDHQVRVAATVALGRGYTHRESGAVTVADLSCGNGLIAQELCADPVLGDYAEGFGYQHHGMIEDTIVLIDPVDLFVCCETLEHLDDPGTVLAQIRKKAARLLLSTPLDAWYDSNFEHYWAWDREGVEELLRGAGFGSVDAFVRLEMPSWGPYTFGIWAVS